MNVICLQDAALYELVDTVLEKLQSKYSAAAPKWVSLEECMSLLNIKSKSTIQKLRDEGKIRYSQPQPRIILYDRESIDQYLEEHAKNTF